MQKELDAIYAGDPADFTKSRDELARSLKKEGEAELAAEVKKLKRPTKAASIINALSLGHSKAIGRVLDSGGELRRIQENLDKANAGEELRAASAEQREAIDAALEIAAAELDASGATLDRIMETLQATASNEAVADAVRTGRVEREGQAAGLGEALVATGGGSRAKKSKPKPAKQKDAKSKAAAERKRRDAEKAVAKAEQKLDAATKEEDEARQRLRGLEKELRAAKATHDGAEKTVQRASAAAAKAKAELEKLSG